MKVLNGIFPALCPMTLASRISQENPATLQFGVHAGISRRKSRWHRIFRTFFTDLFYLLIGIAVFLGVFFFATKALAHTPLMACFDNGDGTVTCNGEFSDGSAAAGVTMRVVDEQDRVLIEGQMNSDSEYTFNRPTGSFTVVFDAGPGHVVKEKSSNID